MVGFLTGSHFWDEPRGGWAYSTEVANEFSMVLTTAVFYHRCREKGREATILTWGGRDPHPRLVFAFGNKMSLSWAGEIAQLVRVLV